MDNTFKRLTGLLLAVLLLFLTIGVVKARRWFKADASNYVNITQPCRDGITFGIARQVGDPILDGVKTEAGTTLVSGQPLPLSDTPVDIPIVGTVARSGVFTLAYSVSLEPGTRIYIRLVESNAVDIFSTVRDCTMAAPDSDPLTTITPGYQGWSQVSIPAGNTVTSTLNVPITTLIADLNLALQLEGDPNTSDPIIITAFLQSPTGTRVQAMNSWADNGYNFGTHGFGSNQCWVGDNSLVGDPKADFNLDDESFFTYAGIGTGDTFGTFTAFRPHQPFSAFDGQNPNGNWRLVIQNESTVDSTLLCWFLELAEGDVPISGLTASNNGPKNLGQAVTLSASVSAGTNVAYSWNPGDGTGTLSGDVVNHTYTATGVYTATVTATNSSSSSQASTTVTITGGSTCTDDGFEDNDSLGQAAVISASSYNGLQICSGDQDFFTIPVAAGEILDVTILFTHAAGDLDLSLYDYNFNTVGISISTSDNETVSHLATGTGSYYIGVMGYGGAENTYDLQVNVSPGIKVYLPTIVSN